MNLQQYQQLTKRTLADCGDLRLNLAHMSLGMYSERNEAEDAVYKNDLINMMEEDGDRMWYVSNLANYFNIDISDDSVLMDSIKIPKYSDFDYFGSRIADLIKRYIAYKKEIDVVLLREYISICTAYIVCKYSQIDFAELLERNIAKLCFRFKDKFTEDEALIRDLDLERFALEGGKS